MKNSAMVWMVAVLCVLGGMAARGDVITGKSSPFRVDTRCKEFVIADVKSAFCHGVYGVTGGKRATFLHGVTAEVEFTVEMFGKDIEVEKVEVNGRELSGTSFTLNVGTLPANVCGPLVVVAHGTVNGSDLASPPFRVNLDMAPPPEGDWLWEGAKGRYRQTDYEPLFMFPAFSELVDLGNQAMPKLKLANTLGIDFDDVPTLSLKREFDVQSGSYRQIGTAGGKIGSVGKGKLTASLKGGFHTMWDPLLPGWQEVTSSATVELRVDEFGWVHYPFSPWIGLYVACLLSGGAEASLESKDGTWRWEGVGDPLVGIKVSGGMGWRNLLGVGMYGGGGLYARLSSDNPFELALDLETGCEYSDIRAGELDKEIAYSHKRIRLLPTQETEVAVYRETTNPEVWKDISERMCRAPDSAPEMVCTPNGSAQVCLMGVENGPAPRAKGGSARDVEGGRSLFTVAVTSAEGGNVETPWDDGTPDSNPRIGVDGSGRLFAVWMNARSQYADGATADEILGMQEIAAAVRDPATGTWAAGNLTTNTVLDASPVLAVATNGVAFAAWLQNDANEWIGATEVPSRLYASRFSGGGWSLPVLVAEPSGAIQSFDLATDGNRAVLVWSEAEDGDAGGFTFGLRASMWEGSSWRTAASLTGDGESMDIAPKVFFGTNGLYSVVWNRDGEWMLGEEGTMAAMPIPVGEDAAIPGEVSLAAAGDGRTAMFWSSGEDVRCMFLDQGSGVWTGPVIVAESIETILSFGAAFDSEGNILLATEEATATVDETGVCEYGKGEIVRSLIPECANPAILATDFAFGTNEVVAGELTPIVMTVRNLGLATASNVSVRLWTCDGELEEDEDARWELYGESGEPCMLNLPGGAAVAVTNYWMAEDYRTNLTFVARVEIPAGGEDADESDNEAVWQPGAASLRLENARCEAVGATVRLLTATVRNGGLAEAEAGTVVSFRLGAPDGEEVGRDVAGCVAAGEDRGYDAGIEWNMADGTWTGAWVTVYAVIDTENAEADSSSAVPIRVMTPLDRDGDGLLDGEEAAMGTEPLNPDTNGDGVSDYEHVYVYFSDPLVVMGESCTTNTPVPVPFSWLEQYPEALAAHGGDYEALAVDTAANGQAFWLCYLTGMNPLDEKASFKACFRIEDGQWQVIWNPDLNEAGTKTNRIYHLEGKKGMLDEKWEDLQGVEDLEEEGWRFFRVGVEMPQE